MSDYTPQPNEVRADFITLHTRNFDAYQVGRSLTSEQEVYGDVFDRMIASVERAAAEKAVARVRSEIRQIPRWWNTELGYGEFDLQPLGPNETSEKGAYMEVMRVLDECTDAYRREGKE